MSGQQGGGGGIVLARINPPLTARRLYNDELAAIVAALDAAGHTGLGDKIRDLLDPTP